MLAVALIMAACGNADKNRASETTDQEEVTLQNLVEVTIDVGGMTCEGCENAIKKSIGSLQGIAEVSASHVDSLARVTYDSTLATIEEIKLKIADAGYQVLN
jgi:copper chaperone CopZ